MAKRGRRKKSETEKLKKKVLHPNQKRIGAYVEYASNKHTGSALTENLTGGQIEELLDSLMIQALAPIIHGCCAFDLQISYLLSNITVNKKRKLSSLPREEAINLMCRYLMTSNPDTKISLLSMMKIERGFLYNFAVNFLKETEGYVELYQRYIVEIDEIKYSELDSKLKVIETSVGGNRNSIFSAINSCKDYLQLAYIFRNNIVMNYLKHSYSQACAFVSMKGKNFDLEDVYQNFLTSISKAIDKYDSSKGALTSYINFWILNAQTTSNSSHGHEYGVAYSIPTVKKKEMAGKKNKEINFSVSLETLVGDDDNAELGDYLSDGINIESTMEKESELNRIRTLVKKADPKGVARLYLDIEEVFSKKEREKMKESMAKGL